MAGSCTSVQIAALAVEALTPLSGGMQVVAWLS